MRTAPSPVGVVYSGTWRVKGERKWLIPQPDQIPGDEDLHGSLLSGAYMVLTPAALVKKECFETWGGFDERLPALEEWDLWIRLSKSFRFLYVGEPLVIWHSVPGSLSTDRKAFLVSTFRIMKKHSAEIFGNPGGHSGIFFLLGDWASDMSWVGGIPGQRLTPPWDPILLKAAMHKVAIMNDPRIEVSVVIPAFNADRFIGQVIGSVLDQTLPGLRAIVIDDGPPTRRTDRRQIEDPRNRLIEHEPELGSCPARNVRTRAAAGRWIVPMDADDAAQGEAREASRGGPDRERLVGSDRTSRFSGYSHGSIPWRTLFDVRGIRARSFIASRPRTLSEDGCPSAHVPDGCRRDRKIVSSRNKGHDGFAPARALWMRNRVCDPNELFIYDRISQGPTAPASTALRRK